MIRFATTFLVLTFSVAAGVSHGQTIFPGQTGSQLLESLRTTYKPSSVLDINDSRDTLFGVLHLGPGDVVTGVYTGMQITLNTAADPNTDALAKGLNTEHTLPQSVGATEGTQAHADLHNLYPSRIEANSARSNYPLAEIDDDDTDVWYCGTQELTEEPDVSIIDTCSELDSDAQLFEPREDQKGNAARAIFYMFTMYQDQMDRTYFAEQRSTLEAWHDNDPVDSDEETRSDAIATYQDGKVNPFIEDATLADRAFFSGNTSAAGINEIRTDQNSTDNDEYFELFGLGNGDLTGLTYIVIGDGPGGSGVIEHATDLSGLNLGGSGYFVGAEETFSLATEDLTTTLNFENSDNVSHLLVEGFTGYLNLDIDTNDDGTPEISPWSSIVTCVSLVETVGTGEEIYCGTTVGPDGTFAPGHVWKANNGSWQIGLFDPVGTDDTPGGANELPVELVDMEVTLDGTSAVISWRTLSENGNAGFQVESRYAEDEWSELKFVEGYGTSSIEHYYEIQVDDLEPGPYAFRLKQIDLDGSFEYSPVIEVIVDLRSIFLITDAYPNPFQSSSSFSVVVQATQNVTIDLYNLLGQRIAPLYSGQLGANDPVEVQIDGQSLTSGIYVYRVVGESFATSRQITLIK